MELIQFTERAIQTIKQYQISLHIPPNHYLRVGIRQKNETNKRLLIGFDTQTEKDKLVSIQGIEVIYHPGEVFFFAGMVIDYVEENDRKGFTFIEANKVLQKPLS